MKILVIGGTGKVGAEVVKELQKRKADIRLLVRKEGTPTPQGVEVASGDLLDPVSVEKAMHGVDKLYLLNAVSPDELTQGLIPYDLAKKLKLKHIVYHSVFRVEHFKDVPHFASKLASESVLREFEVPFTIIRPNYFVQNDATLKDALIEAEIYPAPLGYVGISMVDIRDIAEATAIVLTSEEHNGKTYKQRDSLRGTRHGCVRRADEKFSSVVVGIRHPNDVSRVSRTWFRRGDGRYREVDETPRPRAAPLRGFCSGNRRPLEAVNASKHSKPNLKENEMSSALETIPVDDPKRSLTVAQPENLPHIGLVGDTYTITVTGEHTAGRFCVIDMHIPPGGGPPPHRHDFEETFILLEGQMEATFRGQKSTVRAGETLNIPANAPHQFHNTSGQAVRMLCICSPAGQEKFFLEVGVPVATRTTAPPQLSEKEQAAFIEKVKALAPKYRTELLRQA
jgi:uncharacterized protein YbjT (DUF2867 family)/quercetin dioxygenase-like cupin family protein